MSQPPAQRRLTPQRRFALKSLKRKDTLGLMLLGDEKIGKTALVHRWMNEIFEEKYKPTVEEFYETEVFTIGRKVNIGLVDIAGSNQFPAMDELYIRKSDVIIFVYEIGNEKSVKSVERYYDNVKKIIGDRNVTFAVAGTKYDKYDESGYFGDDEIGKDYFHRDLPKQFLTSAKNDVHVKELFEYVIKVVASQMFPDEARIKALQSQSEEPKKCCTIL